MEEMVEIVDESGATIGVKTRSEVHDNPSLLHKVVHVLVFDDTGKLLLQKRSQNKDVAPGKWDTSVGGHVSPGEDKNMAAEREMKEELGIAPQNVVPLYTHVYRDKNESELVFTYQCICNGPFPFNRDEIDEVAFWLIDDIRKAIGSGIFSGHFEAEMERFLSQNR